LPYVAIINCSCIYQFLKAGKLLARRICGKSDLLTNYDNIPTTVFTPLEYGCCGLSEEDATLKYGGNNITVFHTNFTPLEWILPHRPENTCYMKLIVRKDNDKVIGFHYLGPNSGEVTQGFAGMIALEATKKNFDDIIGIHPTCAEGFTTLNITKLSGSDPTAGGC
jgi:pyruvate/2-oxoglutarate dehydrogenase complex dihydrolipoamide dehydrogenase (E3) component